MNFASRLLITGFTAFWLLQYIGCASRGRPGGGPVDKTPPEIVYTFPQPDSLNIDQIANIDIHFSERMDETSVANSIFTSPPMEYDIDWSGGDQLSLKLKHELDNDRTYLITIGTGAMDARKNRMNNSFQLAFSTGAYLDRGQLSGQVYGITAKDIFYIYAYQIDDPDSLNPTINQADFLTQPSEDGQFTMQYLPLAAYRIFVIEDQNRNLLLDANYERVGIPFRDSHLDSSKMQEGDLNFRVTQIDTVPPMLTGARSLFNNKVLLRFSEPVRHPGHIQIVDTLSLSALSIKSVVQNSENLSQMYAYTAEQEPERGYRIRTNEIEDLDGNVFFAAQIVDFSGSENIDTTRFELLSVTPRDSAMNVKYPAQIEIKFSVPIDTLSLQNSFFCLDENGDTMKGIWHFEDLINCSFIPIMTFLPDQQYKFSINQGGITSLFNTGLADSLIQNTFFMISSDEFGSLSGTTNLDAEQLDDGFIEIFPVGRNKESMLFNIDRNNTFYAQWLTAGEYQIGGFIDLDKNNSYSYGTLFPFKYSEPVFINPDTINVRKRWEFSGIKINYPDLNE